MKLKGFAIIIVCIVALSILVDANSTEEKYDKGIYA